MHPLARPAARAAWGNASRQLALDLAARQRTAGFGRGDTVQTALCVRCRFRAMATPARFCSSLPSSNDSGNASNPEPRPSRDGQPAKELPSTTESRRGSANQRFSHLMDTLQSRVLTASQTLNDLTGYSGIEAIKAENAGLEGSLSEAHGRVRGARQAYRTSNARRANTQREVTTLLARKDSWSPADLERFTELYRADHVLEGEVAAAQEGLADAEAEEQRLSQALNAGILKRYHEEQIWSDRIRRASTWGTWGLMGMNFLLFVVLQFVAEPWKRRRMVRGVVEEERGVLEEVRGELAAVKDAMAKRAEPGASTQTQAAPALADASDGTPEASLETWKEILLEPARWKTMAADLYSERRLDLRMRDASALALQGAVTGAAIAGSIVLALTRR